MSTFFHQSLIIHWQQGTGSSFALARVADMQRRFRLSKRDGPTPQLINPTPPKVFLIQGTSPFDTIRRRRNDPSQNSADDALAVIASAREQFNKVTDGKMYSYLDRLVMHCIESPEKAVSLCELREEWWTELILDVQAALAVILQEHGCGDVYREADLIGKDIRLVLTLVEEVHAHALSFPNQIEDWRNSGIFSYQICAEGDKVTI